MKRLFSLAAGVILCAGFSHAAESTAAGPGCLVERVELQSAAEKAGLKAGDMIVEAASAPVRNVQDLQAAVLHAGETLTFGVRRGERNENVTVYMEPPDPNHYRLGVLCAEEPNAVYFQLARPTGNQTVTLLGGGIFPVSGVENSAVNGGTMNIGAPGYSAGGQYMYFLSPIVGFGLDATYSNTGTSESKDFLLDTNSRSHFESLVTLAMVRWNKPSRYAIPYVSFGAGMHSTTLHIDSTPEPGVHWGDTGTHETRSVVDDHASSFALAFGLGADKYIRPDLFFGFEVRMLYLGEATYAGSQQSSGFFSSDFKGGIFNSSVLARLGYKFGAAK